MKWINGKNLLLVIIFTISIHKSVLCDENTNSNRKIGFGIQSAPFPVFGPSLVYNPVKNIGVELFGRWFLDVDFAALRVQYRFMAKRNYNLYGAGLVGIFSDELHECQWLCEEFTETVPGFGVGGGYEYFLPFLDRKLGLNIEIDFIRIAFKEESWEFGDNGFQLVMLGLGIHYYL